MIYAHHNSNLARHTDATKLRAYLPACSLAQNHQESLICRTGHDSSYIVLMSCLSNRYRYPSIPGFVVGKLN